jgi:hypothetical protein
VEGESAEKKAFIGGAENDSNKFPSALVYVARSREQASKQREAHKQRIKNNTSSCNFRYK